MQTACLKHLQQIAFLVFLCLASPATGASLPEFTELAEKTGPAVVNISTVKNVSQNQNNQMQELFRNRRPGTPFDDFFDQFERFFRQHPGGGQPRQQRSLGSGFIISRDGYIVTNNHVIANADEIKVNLQGVEEPIAAKLVGRDMEVDLALLKIDTDIKLSVLKFGDSSKTKAGQWVLAIGNPFGLDHSVTAGIISAKGRIIGSGPFDDFIQTDASINPGNSGGPLLNMQGEVIGINTAIVAAGQGIGFAIPSSMAQKIITQLRENKQVSRGWIGVSIQDLDENTAKALGRKDKRGALLPSVQQGQPADKAGIQAGDIIIRVNGKEVKDSNSLLRTIAGHSPGETVLITVWRKGKEKTLPVVLGERNPQELAKRNAPEPSEKSEEASLGLSLRPVNQQEAQALGLQGTRALLVTDVAADSIAHTAGIRPGDVILQANQQAVTSVKDFMNILEKDASKKGVLLLLINRQGQSLFVTIALEK